MKKKVKAKPVRAWGLKTKKEKLLAFSDGDKSEAQDYKDDGDKIVRVEIREV